MNELKKVLENTIIYTISGILMKCFQFFLLPLYTAYLTTSDYGTTSVINSFLTVMSFIACLSLFASVNRYYVDIKDDKEMMRRFYGTMVSFTMIFSILVAIVLYLFRNSLMEYVFSGIDFFPCVAVCLVTLVFQCQQTIYERVLKSQQRALESGVLSITCFLSTVVLNILFVVYYRMGAIGVLLSTLIVSILYFIYFMYDMYKNDQITMCIDSAMLFDALKYSIPIIPHNLSTHIAVLISQVLIGDTKSIGAVGVYAVAYRIGDIADTVQGYVDSAYGPWLFQQLKGKNDEYKVLIGKAVEILTRLIGFFLVGIALFAHDYIVLLLSKDYAIAWTYVPLIVGTYTIKILYYFYVEVLFYYKKASRLLFLATVTSSMVNIILAYYFVPLYSINGAILAATIAMIIRVAIVVIISRRYDDVGLRLMDFLKNIVIIIFTIGIGLVFSYKYYTYTFGVIDFVYRVFIVLLYIIFVLFPYKEDIIKFLKQKRINSSCGN